jgi:hypothetical protein
MMMRKTADTRPSVGRIVQALRAVLEAPPIRRGVAALQQASALESQRNAEYEAAKAAERRAAEGRYRLALEGGATFTALMKQFAQGLREGDANSNVIIQRSQMNASMSGCYVEMSVVSVPLKPGLMNEAKWDPVVRGKIEVQQQRPPQWSHGATLLYMRLSDGAEYRWYEVSFVDHPLMSGVPRGPYALDDIREVDRAAGPGMHTTQIESGPTSIDGEDMESFIDRWVNRFALAYNGKLGPS